MGENYYEILGVSPEATPNEIKQAYFRLVRRYHPDVAPDPASHEKFLQIQAAYEVLSDPLKRAEYDKTLPKDPLTLSLLASRKNLLRVQEPQLVYVLLTVTPNAEEEMAAQRPPFNLCLALDRSTSMSGERLAAVKRAASMLIDELRPDDIFSVVTFNDRAEVVVPATRGQDKDYLKKQVAAITASGGTEIFQGLQVAYRQVGRFYSPDYLNEIILVTDGHTYGDEDKCYKLAVQARGQGIVITGVGIGHKWNAEFLDRLTAATGGSTHLITSSRHIEAFLETHFRGMGQRLAEQVTLAWHEQPGATLQYAFRLAPDAAPLTVESHLVLGHVPRGDKLQVVMEWLVRPQDLEAPEQQILDGVLRARLPLRQPPTWQKSVALALPLAKEADLSSPPPAIITAMGQLTLYRMQEKAQQDVQAGRIAQATRRLEQLASRLLTAGQPQLAATVRQEVGRVRRTHHLSDEGEKALRFGTRALITPPSSKRGASR